MRAAALLVLLGASAVAAAPAPARTSDAAQSTLQHEVAQLRRERDVSAGKQFYLRLDAGRERLALMLQGVALDDYAASGLELGVPEVLFIGREPRADWDLQPITKGRLEPGRQRDRIEIVAPPPATGVAPAEGTAPSPPPIPKSAEEAYSVPSPYRIVFDGGVSLEVRTRGGEGGRNRSLPRRLLDAAGLRLSDLGSALGVGSRDRIRLRVTLAADDAASLYRSLPPDVALVVVGLDPR